MADRTSAFSYRVWVACAGAAALMLSSQAASAGSGAAVAAPVAAAPAAPGHVAPPVTIVRPHHRGYRPYLPATGAFAYGGTGEPVIQQIPERTSADVRYTYTYDVPWDWAHRYPPNVVPSDRPYVSSCPMQTVTVPGRRGGDHSVTIMRCY
ncbi:hypothetical protein ACQR0Z_20855 [Bradyrhizobium sp. HKCCYLS3077]|uniref:hypothetical protein n=1 Tax=Bradyrhizobium sp. HKCCYLS3077 TaxID=3420761 RepID=UPI003EB8826E